MIKILWLTNIPSPYRVDFFNELGKLCDLTVLFERTASAERDDSWKQFETKNFKAIFLKGKKLGVAEAFCPSVRRYLKKDIYDHIVVTNFSDPTGMLAIMYMKRKHIPYVIESDGAFAGSGKGLKEKIKKHFISGANGYFSTSKQHDLYYKTYGATEDLIYRYPFTSLHDEDVDARLLSKDEKDSLRKKLNITEEFVTVSVGRFSYLNGYGKGYDVLLKAAKELPKNIGWYIIGGQPTAEFADMQARMELTNVHFVDFLGKKALKEYYRAADIFVLMSIGEAWGLVVNEAMACGLPIITTDKCVAGLELVDEHNGALLAVGDDIGLKTKIEQFFADKQLMNDMSAVSLERIQAYTIENMAKRHMEMFLQCKS